MRESGLISRLVGSMTLAEKIGQLTMSAAPMLRTGSGVVSDIASDIRAGRVGSVLNLTGAEAIGALQRIALQETRLRIPLLFGLDVLHGYRSISPIPLGEAAAFDPKLWEETARLAAAEASADGISLTFAPMLDVCRDSRWGRVAEGPGEDPWLASLFATAKVHGFQGRRSSGRTAARFAAGRLAATAKHVGAYGAVTAGLDYASVDISERQLHEVHLPAFRAAVAAGVAAMMPAFVDFAGVPATANRSLLRDIVRLRWGFNGVIVSDYGAIAELVRHGVATNLVEAAAAALNATVDIDMMGGAYAAGLPGALAQGLADIAQVDAAVGRVLELKANLGLFDAGRRRRASPGRPAGAASFHRARTLTRRAARSSVVLLRNAGGILPLAPAGPPILLLGPFSSGRSDELGPWSAVGRPGDREGLLGALRAALPGREVRATPDEPNALAEAGRAGVVILCLGESAGMSGEGASRAHPSLPPEQAALARRVIATGVPTVLVLWSGRPLVEPDLLNGATAAIAAWFPGSEGARALSDILIGTCEPVGRLVISWPAEIGQIPVFFGSRPTGRPFEPGNRYSLHYIDASIRPQFPFGHGLSYGRFETRLDGVSPSVAQPGDRIRVSVTVRNVGTRGGEETVFLFVRDRVAAVARPVLELRGFRRVAVAAGEARKIRFELHDGDFAYLGPDLTPRVDPGEFDILVGPSADHERLVAARLIRAEPRSFLAGERPS